MKTPPSRQTRFHRRNDLAQLKQCADLVPLIVTVDEAIGPYVVSALDGRRLVAGRYQIAYTFILGYAEGMLGR